MRLVLPLVAVLLAPTAAAQTFAVVQKRALWPDGHGELIITEDSIEFRAAGKEQNSRRWPYADIQHLDRVSPTELVLLSFEDQKWHLGRDRSFRFVLTAGEITDQLFETLRGRMNKPATDRVVGEVESAAYEVAVKHLHTFGGCEGRLLFTEDGMAYETAHAKDARDWRLDTDVESVWSEDSYRLEIHVFENNRREFSRTRVYDFALKQPLDANVYRDLKMRLYGLAQARNPSR